MPVKKNASTPRSGTSRSPPFPAASADVVRPPRPRPAVAPDARSVRASSSRGHAAADAGRSRAAEIQWLGSLPDDGGAGGRASGGRRSGPGTPSATTCVRGGSTRLRARSVTKYGGELPSDEATLLSFKGIGAYTARGHPQLRVRQARRDSRHERGARAVSSSWRTAIPKPRDGSVTCGRSPETVLPMRHVFDFNQALMDFGATICARTETKCLVCPMAKGCRAYPFTPTNDLHCRHRCGRDRSTAGFSSPAGRKACTSRASGSFPAGSATRMKR